MDLWLGGSFVQTQKFGTLASRNFHGKDWAGSATRNINVPVDWASVKKSQKFAPGSAYVGKMPGSEVQHDTIPWFVYDDALLELK